MFYFAERWSTANSQVLKNVFSIVCLYIYIYIVEVVTLATGCLKIHSENLPLRLQEIKLRDLNVYFYAAVEFTVIRGGVFCAFRLWGEVPRMFTFNYFLPKEGNLN
jgi:hypothetical protein